MDHLLAEELAVSSQHHAFSLLGVHEISLVVEGQLQMQLWGLRVGFQEACLCGIYLELLLTRVMQEQMCVTYASFHSGGSAGDKSNGLYLENNTCRI